MKLREKVPTDVKVGVKSVMEYDNENGTCTVEVIIISAQSNQSA